MKIIIAIAVVLGLFGKNQALDVLRKWKGFPYGELHFSDYSFKDGLLVYAVCENQTAESERKCTINQEVSPYSIVSRSCSITIKSEDKNGKISDLFVGALNPDTAILSYLEEGSKILDYIGTVDLNKCTVNVKHFVDDEKNEPIAYWQWKNVNTIVRYKNHFDVFFKLLPCGDKECKVSINAKGHFISGNEPSQDMNRLPHYISKVNSIDSASPDKGYVYRKYSEKDVLYMIQKPDRSEKLLTTSPEAVSHDIVSTSNNIINIYFKSIGPNGSANGNMTLLQYDADGNNILTTNLSEIKDSMVVLNIYNLPEGGSMLLVSDVEDQPRGCSKVKSYSLIKIDATGKKVGEISVHKGLGDDKFYDTKIDRDWRYIWKTRKGGYCVTIVGPANKCTLVDIDLQNDLQIVENCFTDAIFST